MAWYIWLLIITWPILGVATVFVACKIDKEPVILGWVCVGFLTGYIMVLLGIIAFFASHGRDFFSTTIVNFSKPKVVKPPEKPKPTKEEIKSSAVKTELQL